MQVDPLVGQLQLAVAQLNQKVQQLSSQPKVQATPTVVPTTTPAYREINPVITLITSGTSTSWTTLNLGNQIGKGVSRVVLNGYMFGGSAAELDFRSDANSITRIAMKTNGAGGGAFTIEIPISGKTLQYQLSANVTTLHVNVIEAYST